ncbi:hypothetical protein [Streptomyces exfoliatus]|uniref:hypothetical protein n=1 Tax=Streptomyces exfoliatus TaxID=1905 RepID=UPI0004C517E4|nr:hypothetical protein [Streptomyces exfoliatus]
MYRVAPVPVPAVGYVHISDPAGEHVFIMATFADSLDGLVAAYQREPDLIGRPFAFTDNDTQITTAVCQWLLDAAKRSDQPPSVLVGSIEKGRWVNWNLPGVPRPTLPF